jgi:hypothetical protein
MFTLHCIANSSDPVCYSGTIRFNLDPFEESSDHQVWQALEHVCLKSTIEAMELQLLAPVSEGGENLSVGQRCQICLARALLRQSKILILDEATASIDMETDSIIQTTIRRAFANSTLLTIAHRLNTIIDYDRVVVLEHGVVKEFATPAALLRDPSSLFFAMVQETGARNADVLRDIAFDVDSRKVAAGRTGEINSVCRAVDSKTTISALQAYPSDTLQPPLPDILALAPMAAVAPIGARALICSSSSSRLLYGKAAPAGVPPPRKLPNSSKDRLLHLAGLVPMAGKSTAENGVRP